MMVDGISKEGGRNKGKEEEEEEETLVSFSLMKKGGCKRRPLDASGGFSAIGKVDRA